VLNRRNKRGETTELSLAAWNPRLRAQSGMKFSRWSIISGNLILLLIVAIFVLANRSASQTVRSSTVNSATTTAGSLISPLDQLSSSQIALQAAQMTNMPELTMVRNRADSETASLAVAQSDATILAKPQVVSTTQKSRFNIVHYTVINGDTVSSLAVKFNVSANAIRWSNNIQGDSLRPGSTLLIPPAEGVVYQVKARDTIDSIVNKYQANKDTFISVNDAESGHLTIGELVWIPNGQQATPLAAHFTQLSFGSITGGFRYSGPCISNGYDCGWCTWWAAFRWSQTHGSPFPKGMGDAYSWASLAPSHGLAVSFKPPGPGVVIWFPGADHVGFVESINSDGSVYVSEMHVTGYNVVTYRTIPPDQVSHYKYIY
jgi:LysM repeat protein